MRLEKKMDKILDRRIMMHRYLISVVLLLLCGVFEMNAQSKENEFSLGDEMVLWEEYLDSYPDMFIDYISVGSKLNSFTEIEKDINKRISNLDEYYVFVEQSIDNGLFNVYLIYPDNVGPYWQSLVWTIRSYGEIFHRTFEAEYYTCSPENLFSYYTNARYVFGATSIYVKHVKNGIVYRHAFYMRINEEVDACKIQSLLNLCCIR